MGGGGLGTHWERFQNICKGGQGGGVGGGGVGGWERFGPVRAVGAPHRCGRWGSKPPGSGLREGHRCGWRALGTRGGPERAESQPRKQISLAEGPPPWKCPHPTPPHPHSPHLTAHRPHHPGHRPHPPHRHRPHHLAPLRNVFKGFQCVPKPPPPPHPHGPHRPSTPPLCPHRPHRQRFAYTAPFTAQTLSAPPPSALCPPTLRRRHPPSLTAPTALAHRPHATSPPPWPPLQLQDVWARTE